MDKIKIIEIRQLIKKLLKLVVIFVGGYILYIFIVNIFGYFFDNFEEVSINEQKPGDYFLIGKQDSLTVLKYLNDPNGKTLIEIDLNNFKCFVFSFVKKEKKMDNIEQFTLDFPDRKLFVSGEFTSGLPLFNENFSLESIVQIGKNDFNQFEIRFATKIDSTIEKTNYRIYFANDLPQSFYLLNDERRILSKFKKKYDYFSSLIMVDSPDRFRLYYIINEKDKKPDLNTIFSTYIEPTLLH